MTASIGNYAFAPCSSLTAVTLPVATSIGHYAFQNCSTLASVSLPMAASIGNYAFDDCSSLTTVSLPAATSIGERAFANTGGTTPLTVTLGNTVPDLGINMFDGVTVTKTVNVSVPSSVPAWSGIVGTYTGVGLTLNWGNGFRGGGWSGITMGSGTINSNISLTIATY
jgi:hypothetical protein